MFPVLSGEIYDPNQFKFELDYADPGSGQKWRAPQKMRWEFWETNWTNSVWKEGAGDSFTIGIYEGSSHDIWQDDCFVRFYSDVQDKEKSANYSDGIFADSSYFRPRLLKQHDVVVYSATSSNASNFSANAAAATDKLKKKDSAIDYRASVIFSATQGAPTWPSAVSVTQIRNKEEYDAFDSEAGAFASSSSRKVVFILDNISYFPEWSWSSFGYINAGPVRGFAPLGGKWMALNANLGAHSNSGETFVHEYGHLLGLPDLPNGDPNDYIMKSGGTNRTKLKEHEANKYTD